VRGLSPTMNIFQATTTHLSPALSLLTRFLAEEDFHTPHERIERNLKEMIDHPATAVFLAWQDDEAIGVATVRYSPSIEHGFYAEIEDLYVLPQARGTGVAKAIVAYVCEWCKERNCSRVEVCITPEGEAAHGLSRFYDKLGFAATGRDMLYKSLL
jgi:GNAT superfamily N-acetyltransferase